MVISIGVLLAIGPQWVRQHTVLTVAVLGGAMVYAAVVMAYPQLEVRRTRYAWLVTGFDSAFTLALIALSGGVYSPVVAVLALAVIASAARLSFRETLLVAVLLGAAYIPVALMSSPRLAVTAAPALQAGWSAVYLIFIAIITAGLSALAEREHRSRLRALVEAEAEHAAAEEERDLRARLLRSYQSQQDGLQVLVHELRTPVTSLEALTEALTSEQPMSRADRDTSLALVARHVHHLTDMLDALSDVALSRRPTFSAGRVRRVDVADLVVGAADAVGLAPPRLRLSVSGDLAAVAVNAQGLRRVLTNLLENASRHGRRAPVDVMCSRQGDELICAVADRGPGIPADSLGELTTKYVSVGGQRGTAGLGLWIVQQIAESMGGRVDFAARDGGGLVATFRAPIG
ncbi:ATPase/histidine kinase/DNA gyrase B/HSP90 domain protein [Mycobacterium parascrofulaceum ATCC BAA-614]|uniref:histidine kinase n=1 Tax=Mycobacterium parascrofulaceum ATCC BAA-614 TaxID=525368 RepID=D5PIK5_9MYCO|nr:MULTISPECIES: HAMP domain-containing sensor histidine kinase [Mycobacterium]EFG74114.1 ATPase/histidine kinase/DNA gyrase B/HSP90 domain protein [Mycobacterium parascrofulaceum ATCC BAA-614]OCB62906.1 ATPase [Mycobacterium malmoense]